MAEDPQNDEPGDLRLPPKFISVHPLAAKKGSHYTCVICSSDGTFLCKLCRSCYCCREHLLLDDLACHAVLCERQAAIIEIKSLPLATRTRPDTAGRLFQLQDECRRIAYLESRRHVLEGHHELALPAAERSLTFAREVHGQNSIDLVPPLLALADVATIAGAKEALGYVSRAAFLIQERYSAARQSIEKQLDGKIKTNLVNLAKINKKAIDQYLEQEKAMKESRLAANWSPQRSTTKQPVQIVTMKTLLQQAVDLQLENALRSEIFNTKEGIHLAFLTSKYWSSNAKILVWEDRYDEALRSVAIALYFATFSCGVHSLQTCLCIYQLAHLGQLSEQFSENQQVQAFLEAQRIFKDALLQYYSPLVLQIDQLVQDRKLVFAYDSEQLKMFVQDYNRAEYMKDEDRLSFRADIKEAVQRAVYSLQGLEKKYGQESPQYCECVVLIGIALQCTEDSGVIDWDQQGRACCKALLELKGLEFGNIMCYVYRILYGW